MEDLVKYNAAEFMPLMTIDQATERYKSIVQYVKTLLHEGTDFGKIPGTEKNVLLKPGAEKLCTLFGLTPSYECLSSIEDWTGAAQGAGSPFFYYRYRCTLTRHGAFTCDSEASANSHESKYRWRKGERMCPECGKAAIIKGKAEYGGGWLCFGRKGGCGFKWADGDSIIESQNVDRVPNPDIADQVNTLQKMAQKRALLSACLLAVNASEFFTVDLEDFTDITPEPNGAEPPPKPETPKSKATPKVNAAEVTEIKRRLVDTCKLLNEAGDKPSWSAKRLDEFSIQEYGTIADKLELEPLRELLKKLSLKLDAVKAAAKGGDPTEIERQAMIATVQAKYTEKEITDGLKDMAEKCERKDVPTLEMLSLDQLVALKDEFIIPF